MRAFILAIALLFSGVPGVRAADDAGSAKAVIS